MPPSPRMGLTPHALKLDATTGGLVLTGLDEIQDPTRNTVPSSHPNKLWTGLVIGILVGGTVGTLLGADLPRALAPASSPPPAVSHVILTPYFSVYGSGFGYRLLVAGCMGGANVAAPSNWNCTISVVYNGTGCEGCSAGEIEWFKVQGATLEAVSPGVSIPLHSNQLREVNLTLGVPSPSDDTLSVLVAIDFSIT